MPSPIENNLGLLTQGDTINVEVSTTDGVRVRLDSRFVGVWPNITIPLRLDVIGPLGEEGSTPFAGSREGIVSIRSTINDEVVFHNSNIPVPYFRPISMRVTNEKSIELLDQRKVDMGLIGSVEELP